MTDFIIPSVSVIHSYNSFIFEFETSAFTWSFNAFKIIFDISCVISSTFKAILQYHIHCESQIVMQWNHILYVSLYNMKKPFLKQFTILSHFGSFLHLLSLSSSSQYFGNVEVLFRFPTCEILLSVKKEATSAVLCNMHLNSSEKVKPSHSGFI